MCGAAVPGTLATSGQRTRGQRGQRPDRGPPVNSLHGRGLSPVWWTLGFASLHPTLLGNKSIFYASSPPSARDQFEQGNQSHFMTSVNN